MGLIKRLLQLKMCFVLFGAGYVCHSCVATDQRYRVIYIGMGQHPYLLDKNKELELEIHPDTSQVGTTEYRIKGLLNEPDLFHVLQKIEKEMEERK